ncbi:MAG: hypothetical protein ACXVEF_07645 [Polyangiales bacterium]
MTIPFDTKRAAALLGRPHEAFESITPYQLPEVYWLRIGAGPDLIGGPFIVKDGEPVVFKGYPTAAAWLRRAIMTLESAPDAASVAQVLQHYEALPVGWNAGLADVESPSCGERGGLRLHPFELELVSLGYIHTTSRLLGAPVGPPPSPFPPGGYAPPLPCRAVLKEVDARLTWVVEHYEEGVRWRVLLKERLE